MCIICVSKSGVRQPCDITLRAMFRRNPHGAGYMYARDGKVTGDEVEPFDGIVEDLDDVVQAALAVKYAERTAEGGGEA